MCLLLPYKFDTIKQIFARGVIQMTFNYSPKGVCSKRFTIEVNDGVVGEVKIMGGCSGNLQGIASLLRGMKVEDAIERMEGIRCGFKSTSCPDQLAQALKSVR